MNYSKEFNKLIDDCEQNNQYVGLGNPNANLLIVGKEAGMPIGSKLTHGNAESWKKKNEYHKSYFPKEEKLKNGNHTWQKYQLLYEKIVKESKKQDYEITFVENVFTTELSNLSAPTTNEAKKIKNFKENLVKRKKKFWNNDFIQKFPIVIITSSDNQYIETYQGEVCELFDVNFHEEITFNQSGKIWVHYADKDKKTYPKLVIHTRQLTNGASNELIERIAEIVSDFTKEHSINVKLN